MYFFHAIIVYIEGTTGIFAFESTFDLAHIALKIRLQGTGVSRAFDDFYENFGIPIQNSVKFVPNGPIKNNQHWIK